MKTKLLLSFLFLLTFLENTSAQEYHPLLENPSWIVYDWVSCCRPPVVAAIQEGVDTVIGAYTYKKFIDPFPHFADAAPLDTIYLREDVAEKKVYKIVNGSDFLLYDFSLENDDHITIGIHEFVATVDEITVNGGTRKRITLESIEEFNGQHVNQIWIEGVGTNAHPFYPDFFMFASVFSSGGGYRVYTRCSFEDGVHVFGNSDCDSLWESLGVSQNQIPDVSVAFSPNPFSSVLTIDSQLNLQDASFQLYNLQGQLVKQADHLSGQKMTISRGNLTSGMYLAQLSENGKTIKSIKIMVD